jgi:hypothetical protein
MNIREMIKNDIETLSDENLCFVREFVLFQKQKSIDAINTSKGLSRLRKYKGTLNREINIKKEINDARDEKHGRIF